MQVKLYIIVTLGQVLISLDSSTFQATEELVSLINVKFYILFL